MTRVFRMGWEKRTKQKQKDKILQYFLQISGKPQLGLFLDSLDFIVNPNSVFSISGIFVITVEKNCKTAYHIVKITA